MGNVRPLLDKKRQALAATERGLPRSRAVSIAFRARTTDLVDEMEGAGEEGLCWAALGFSATEGIPFRPYAQTLVDRAIFRFLRKEMPFRKLKVAGYVICSWAASEIAARSIDVLDPMWDDDEKCLEKLHHYIDPKVMAGALALVTDAERQGDEPDQVAFAAQALAIVRRELSGCDHADQFLFSAIYGEGKSTEEAAAELDMPPATARSRHSRLLRALRKAVDSEVPARGVK